MRRCRGTVTDDQDLQVAKPFRESVEVGMFNRLSCRTIPIAILGLSLAITIFAQSPASISVTGDVKLSLNLTAADLATMPRATASTNNNGIVTVYEGVWLSEVLKKAG